MVTANSLSKHVDKQVWSKSSPAKQNVQMALLNEILKLQRQTWNAVKLDDSLNKQN